jgi:tetratricopeptide (TPR) repeat protein
MDGLSMLYLRSGNPQLALPLLERITAITASAAPPTPPFSLSFDRTVASFHPFIRPLLAASGVGGGALINLGIAYKNLRRYDDALGAYAQASLRMGQLVDQHTAASTAIAN